MSEHTGLAAKLKELGEKATPGDWSAKLDDGSITLTSMFDPIGSTICGSIRAKDARLVSALKANLPAIIAALEARPSPADERAILEVIDERDIAQASADKLADIIARITGVELGEYTAGLGAPGNDPILNAVDAGESYLRARPSPATEGEVEAIISDDLMRAVGLGVIYKTKSNGVETDKPDILATEELFCTAYVALHKARAALSAARPSREGEMRAALERTKQTLCVPAAEYVPAIRDAFDIIDAALQPQQQKEA